MLRLIGFIALAIVLTQILAHLPLIGGLFRHTGIFGIWITAILLSWAFTHYGQRALVASRDRAQLRALEAVDNPHNHGKAGSLLLAQGRASKALPHLEQAVAGDPDSAEWRYRLGSALMMLRRPDDAREHLQRCVEIDEEYAYGAAQMKLAEALLAGGHKGEALAALDVVERNHGPTPESRYRRGVTLKALGRRDEAKASFREVSELAAKAVQFQKKSANVWVMRAWVAGLF